MKNIKKARNKTQPTTYEHKEFCLELSQGHVQGLSWRAWNTRWTLQMRQKTYKNVSLSGNYEA